MLLGKGAATRKLSSHRINLTSSTKSDIIGVDNRIPDVLWTLNFLGASVSRLTRISYTRITRVPSSWRGIRSIFV